ncbi:MAG: amino acid adenylation domain-containing protein, partial [bacterium]|nr:amino acid adenylation domain-containing protein [bacterium]
MIRKLNKNTLEHMFGLSTMQEGILYHYLNAPQEKHYFEQLTLDISGAIDRELFEKAWNLVISSNQMLRTLFRWEKLKQPVQIVLKEHSLHPHYYDLSNNAAKGNDIYKDLDEIIIADLNNPFDLQDIAFRITLCKIRADKYKMIISNHHILYDGWSNGIILKEFFSFYNDLSSGKTVTKRTKVAFHEYIRQFQNREKTNNEHKFWKEFLKGFDTSNSLSIKKRKNVNSEAGNTGTRQIQIDKEFKKELDDYVRENKITLAALLYGSWGVLLQKYNNCGDVVFGTTVAGRQAKIKDIENIVGLFINTPLLRVREQPNEKIHRFLKRINHSLLARKEYENSSLVDIKEYCEHDGSEELFDNIMVIENYPLDHQLKQGGGPLVLNSFSMFERTHYDLSVEVTLFDDINVSFTYKEELFEEGVIERLSRHYITLLKGFVRNPGLELSQMEILSEEDKKQLLHDFNDTACTYAHDKTIYELFEEQVKKTPDGIALAATIHESPLHTRAYLTYRELNKKAGQLAQLLTGKGITPGGIAGIMVNRSISMIIGILGILKTGSAYLPIDPEHPEARTRYVLTDSCAGILLTERALTPDLTFNKEVVFLDEELDGLAPVNAGVPVITGRREASNIAYVTYTSGSTGKPKGVIIENRSMANFIKGITDVIPFTEEDGILCLTTISFDIFGLETLLPLTKGSRVFIGNANEQLNPAAAARIMSEEKITIFQATPSRLQLLITDEDASPALASLSYLLVGGEAFPAPLLEKIRKLTAGQTKLYNVYGPTETTVWSTIKDVTGTKVLNIGHPIANTQIYILGASGAIQPIGAVGELCISGDGLARGYLNRPELTSEKFIPLSKELCPDWNDPKKESPTRGFKLYRTGDLARWLPDGNIEFMERIDHQVKIRGFRIELGEIEDQVSQFHQVKETVVVALENKTGDKYLCAYIVPASQTLQGETPLIDTIDIPGLKNHLEKNLPHYMVPAHFLPLPRIPLTPNGKVDRKSLPQPEITATAGHTPPRNKKEELLAGVWAEILDIDKKQIGIDNNFFELGGHSIKATRMISRVHKETEIYVPLPKLFKNPTIRAFALLLEKPGHHENNESKNNDYETYMTIPPAGEKPYYPLTSSQNRLYIMQEYEKSSTVYNITAVFDVTGVLDTLRLETTFMKLIRRHESLRASVSMEAGRAVQRIHPEVEFEIEYATVESEAQLPEGINRCVRPFDLSRAPLLRVGLLSVSNAPADESAPRRLVVDMHHIISDGVSTEILAKEFAAIYAGEELPSLKIQYTDYAAWRNLRKDEDALKARESYWLNQ